MNRLFEPSKNPIDCNLTDEFTIFRPTAESSSWGWPNRIGQRIEFDYVALSSHRATKSGLRDHYGQFESGNRLYGL